MNEDEARVMLTLAIGRLLRIGSRPYQPGDDKTYADCRAVAMEAADVLRLKTKEGYRYSYARDRMKGAQGD